MLTTGSLSAGSASDSETKNPLRRLNMSTFMELLERFVAAHEKQADAAMLLAENGKASVMLRWLIIARYVPFGSIA